MALAVGIVAVGCGDDIKPIKRDRPSWGPVQPAATKSTPLPDPVQPIDHSPTMVAAPPPGYLVDAKVLVISADGGDSELDAIEQTLRYLGTPYDLIVASQAATLTAAQLGTSMHGKYNGIILTTGNLVLSGGGSAFSAAEFATRSDNLLWASTRVSDGPHAALLRQAAASPDLSDDEILEAHRILSSTEGIFVEPGSAASIAGLLKMSRAGRVPADATVVCTVTGHGLKDPQWALRTADGSEVQPVRVPVDAFSVASALGLEG